MSAENEVATSLISNGAVLISQHADTTGAPSACEAAGVPCVGYNVDMTSVAPSAALTSAANNWGAYYTIAGQSLVDGTEIPVDNAETALSRFTAASVEKDQRAACFFFPESAVTATVSKALMPVKR